MRATSCLQAATRYGKQGIHAVHVRLDARLDCSAEQIQDSEASAP